MGSFAVPNRTAVGILLLMRICYDPARLIGLRRYSKQIVSKQRTEGFVSRPSTHHVSSVVCHDDSKIFLQDTLKKKIVRISTA